MQSIVGGVLGRSLNGQRIAGSGAAHARHLAFCALLLIAKSKRIALHLPGYGAALWRQTATPPSQGPDCKIVEE